MNKLGMKPDIAAGIASISPILGCSSGCAYCYIDLRGASRPAVNLFGLNETVHYLLSDPAFQTGPEGTVLCFGGWGELFPHTVRLREESFIWLERFAPLGNPIVLFTKASLTEYEIESLKDLQTHDRQILLLETITCIERYRNIEPGTDGPHDRIDTLKRWSNAGMSAGVLINPFLREFSLEDYPLLLDLLQPIPLGGLVVSPLFLNAGLLEKIKHSRALQPIYDRTLLLGLERGTHMGSKEFRVYADEINDLYDFLFSEAAAYRIPAWKHYLCLIMNSFHRYNADVFGKEFCVDCGHCRQVY